jgi:hypothetical protein
VIDGRLVTGQDPASSTAAAKALMELLAAKRVCVAARPIYGKSVVTLVEKIISKLPYMKESIRLWIS